MRYQHNLYTAKKSTFSRLQFCRRHYGSIFIHLAVVASQNREIPTKFDLIARSSKVIDVNGKPICDFLLVINCNYSRICYRFWDIHA